MNLYDTIQKKIEEFIPCEWRNDFLLMVDANTDISPSDEFWTAFDENEDWQDLADELIRTLDSQHFTGIVKAAIQELSLNRQIPMPPAIP